MGSREPWGRQRLSVFVDQGSRFRLDCSRMGIPDGFWQAMAPAMTRAFDAMQALERGEIANPSEGRMVGHYWLRAPGLAPTPEIAQEISRNVDRVLDFAARIHEARLGPPHAARFEKLLVIGIGGSALGPQFVSDALRSSSDPMQTFFLDNTDPDGIDRVLQALRRDLAATLSIVISKSGGTPETRNGMLETAAAYRAQGLELGAHALAITQQGSALDRSAQEQGFLERFPMWDWVGGRTSVTSAVGLVPAALQGIDVRALLAGAAEMDRLTRTREIHDNPAAKLALAWHHAGSGRGEKDMVILPYKDRLALMSRYLQQLVMESLGKERDVAGRVVHQGLTVYGNKGSTDQHAYVQQLRDGLSNFFVTFVEVLRDREGGSIEVEPGVTSGDFLHGLLLGTESALHESGRPSLTLSVSDVSPRSLGMLIALYERAVGLYASLCGINAYDQPGVEAGKKAAAAVLDLERRIFAALRARAGRGATAEELSAEAGSPDDVETAFRLLEHLAANPERGVERQAGATAFDALYRTHAP